MSSTEARSALRGFVLARNRDLCAEELQDDTPLITSRLVTSLHLVDMLLLLESLRRAPIDVRRMTPGSFHNIDVIVETFLQEEA